MDKKFTILDIETNRLNSIYHIITCVGILILISTFKYKKLFGIPNNFQGCVKR